MAKFVPGLYITAFADASYCHRTGACGYGWWVKHGHPGRTERGSGSGVVASSLDAEVAALHAVMEYVGNGVIDTQGKILVVQSDCTGALAKVQAALTLLTHNSGLRCAYSKHVKGHQGHACPRSSVNTYCDQVAKQHMRATRARLEQFRGEDQ